MIPFDFQPAKPSFHTGSIAHYLQIQLVDGFSQAVLKVLFLPYSARLFP